VISAKLFKINDIEPAKSGHDVSHLQQSRNSNVKGLRSNIPRYAAQDKLSIYQLVTPFPYCLKEGQGMG
jgi:hypothetical protein